MPIRRPPSGRSPATRQDEEELSAFLALSSAHRELILRNSPRAFSVAAALARRCYSLRFEGLHEMLYTGHLAAEVADGLTVRQTRRSAGELGDLRAEAWAVYGNALRIQGSFGRAGQALATAGKHLDAGTGRRRDLAALLLELSASLAAARHSYEEAQDLLARAHPLRIALEDRQGAGKVRIQQGIVTGEAGDPERAARILFEGLDLVQDDPDLVRAGFHSLAWHLLEAGQADRARRVLARVRVLLEEGGSLFLLKLRWLDTRLEAAEGSCSPALLSTRYFGVRLSFSRHGLDREARLVDLDCGSFLLRWA